KLTSDKFEVDWHHLPLQNPIRDRLILTVRVLFVLDLRTVWLNLGAPPLFGYHRCTFDTNEAHVRHDD
ncbi:MAG: hypothetical protein VW684_14080, partial [Betaproteobacteria bacterium]